ncbi:MAG: methionine gamma-lyase family protein [Oscillospiraceae bacterium]|nr:methionine gamma-lyase family protein [Oscillospiraceae bacterium]
MNLTKIAAEAESVLDFKPIDEVAYKNTEKVLNAFREMRVSDAMFMATSGYGYDDKGRDTLDQIYAQVFNAEAAFARHNIVSGTHALTIALFGLLRPGDVLLSITGKPYDTLDEVIGGSDGSLKDFGIDYRQVELGEDYKIDEKVKVVFIQRSKGYTNRRTLPVDEINDMIKYIRSVSNAYIIVDNCYGEFAEETEPCADLLVGSLIKNPGGGIAESGGYLAGTKRAVELASYRYTSAGIGLECGASLGQNKSMYKGLFFAPHVVAQAKKTAMFAAYVFEKLGFEVEPKWDGFRGDIIQAVKLNAPEYLCAFCRGIQKGSPVDSFVTPEPWEMPGYSDKVIMAAGTFTQGSSIELSADGPMRPPYTVYFQGGLTYESGKIGILSAAEEILKIKNGS